MKGLLVKDFKLMMLQKNLLMKHRKMLMKPTNRHL